MNVTFNGDECHYSGIIRGMAKYIKVGNLCGDKIQFKDGVAYCVWYPFPDDETTGLCFDMEESDVDSLIELLTALKAAPAMDVDE